MSNERICSLSNISLALLRSTLTDQKKGGDMSSTGFSTYQVQKIKGDYHTYLTTRLSINQNNITHLTKEKQVSR